LAKPKEPTTKQATRAEPKAPGFLMRAVTAFTAATDEGERIVHQGEVIDGRGPMVASHPELFENADELPPGGKKLVQGLG
jgi:hypothetical protein